MKALSVHRFWAAEVSPKTVRWGGTLLPQAAGRAMEWPATTMTAASGGIRELLLGPRPAKRKRKRSGCWEPQLVLVSEEKASVALCSVMEQPDAAERHGDAVLVAGVNDLLVADGAAGLDDGRHAGAAGTLDVVAKGEERVRAQADARYMA